jgi:hypothetical protein
LDLLLALAWLSGVGVLRAVHWCTYRAIAIAACSYILAPALAFFTKAVAEILRTAAANFGS